MVKVCSFSLFKEQKILTPKTGEPLAIALSEELLFIAEDGCVLEIYPLDASDPLAQIRTVAPVVECVFNARGDAIVTLERKNEMSRMFARVYFKWRDSSIDRPVRVSLIGTLTKSILSGSPHTANAEIVELPADETFSVSCVAVCKETGRIAVGMDSRIRLFSLVPEYEGSSVVSHSIEILLDIETSLTVRKVSVFTDYVAFVSASEARVLKLSLLGEGPNALAAMESEASSTTLGWESDSTQTSIKQPRPQLIDRNKESTIQTDTHFVSWSPSKVWEEERQSAGNSLNASTNLSHDPEPHPLFDRPSRGFPPTIETLGLPAITMATQERTVERHPVEVCGPVEYVWGQPAEAVMGDSSSAPRCRLLTMLYRRFPGASPELPVARSAMSLPAKLTLRAEEAGLHTVELVPVRVEDSQTVIGVSCFIGNRLHGYLYDVGLKTQLISSFSFMTDTVAVASDGYFFHALSGSSVESYSNRALQAALFSRPAVESSQSHWLGQPCPSPSMDLTMLASSQLIGGTALATTKDTLVVLTKSADSAPSPSTNWIIQSLRRPVAEPSWNIYILRKKDPLPLYHQFVEYGASIQGTSPPMYQHMISEAHVLLRSTLIQGGDLGDEVTVVLRENCFSLADSLCSDTREHKHAPSIAARYFMLSGATMSRVVTHITSNYTQPRPFAVLMKYLGLVLSSERRGEVEPIANSVADLYATQRPRQLAGVVMSSPLGHLVPEHCLGLLSAQSGALKSADLRHNQLCQVVLLLRVGSSSEAKAIISNLPDDWLLSWLRGNMAEVLSEGRLSPLGQLLWGHSESCLLELLHSWLLDGRLTLGSVVPLLQNGERSLADNTLLKALLERVVLAHSQDTPTASLNLVDLLLARLDPSHTPRPSPSTPFSLYGNRHKWLDCLPPFNKLSSGHAPSQTLLQDLMQLQALLCSSDLLPVPSVAQHMHSQVNQRELPGALSLRLLSWPHVGRLREATQLVLRQCPEVTVEFCLSYLPSQLGPWSQLLSQLQELVVQEPHRHTHRDLYRRALEHVVTLTSPAELLALLPSNGSLAFYLPFIDRSLQQDTARQLGSQITPVK